MYAAQPQKYIYLTCVLPTCPIIQSDSQRFLFFRHMSDKIKLYFRILDLDFCFSNLNMQSNLLLKLSDRCIEVKSTIVTSKMWWSRSVKWQNVEILDYKYQKIVLSHWLF